MWLSVFFAIGAAAHAPSSAPTVPAVRYNDADALQSPITADLAAYWRAFVAAHPHDPHVFAKLGDSLTVNPEFFACFSEGHRTELGAHPELERTLKFFSKPIAGAASSFDRKSVAAKEGQALGWLQTHYRSELTLINPTFATVMIGTNDLNFGGTAAAIGPQFWRNTQALLYDLVDDILAAGVIPILSTIPSRKDAAKEVSTYNAIVRAVAQARQVPFVDLARGLELLPHSGVGPDGVHLTASPSGACNLSGRALEYGYNQRNLLMLTALDRWSRALFGEGFKYDPDPPPLVGQGSAMKPLVIDRLPFSDARALSTTQYKSLGQYACTNPQPGAEFVYELDVDKPTPLRAVVLGRTSQITCRSKGFECDGASDVTINLLQGKPDGSACIASGNTVMQKGVIAGKYYLAVDTTWVGSDPMVDDYTLVVMRCDDNDPRCL